MSRLPLQIDPFAVSETRVDPDDWARHLSPTGRPQIVVGGPGTGKTQFLCERIAAAVDHGMAPERILVLGFSRSGINDIRSRLIDVVGTTSHRITTATYHSLAMRIVEARATELGWSSPPSVLTGTEQERLVADLLAVEDTKGWPAAYRSILDTDLMAAEVTDFLLRAAEHGLDAIAVQQAGRDQWAALPGFMDRYNETLRALGRIDYGRALREAADLLNTGDALSSAYDLVVADEFQDTSPAQSRMLLAFTAGTPDLVVAADPYQSIYSFRGTDINNVFAFPAAVHEVSDLSVDRLILTTSFRVPAEILDAAVAVTARELPGGAGKVLSTRSGGTVACHAFATQGEEADWIASDIEGIHLTEGIPLERIAVFVRSHTPFIDDLVRAFERRGIEHTYAEERLADEPIIRFLHDLVVAAGPDEDAESALRRVLLGPFVGLPHGLVGSLPDERALWSSWLCGIDNCLVPIADLIEEDGWSRTLDATRGLWHVWSTLPQLAEVAVDPEHDRARRAWSAYAQAVDRLTERAPDTTLSDNAEIAVRFDFEADALFSVHDTLGVTIATLHRSKGTEFDAVFIADAIEGQLPDLRARESLLGVRHLNPHLPTDTADYVTFRLDEERRLAYTAMTRSTSRIVWTATVPSEAGSGTAPSRFMQLVAPSTVPETSGRPLTPRSYMAALRRIVADPAAPAVDRIAGLVALADAELIGRHPLDGYGMRSRGSDEGLVPAELRLSPSQANSYRQCPRRYAIERFLLTELDESVYMQLGTLVHDILERTERAAMDRGQDRGTIEAALLWLDELWQTSGFGDDSVAQAWKARAARILHNLYDLWPTSGSPVALEIDLSLTVEGTPWLGRADRVERSGDGLTVVDYKTGGAMRVTEAERSIQLGYYALAAQEDTEIAQIGNVTGAEFWYPKDTNKQSIVTRSFDLANLADIRDEMMTIADGIRSEAFTATPGDSCRTCPATMTCPALESGEEAFKS